MRNTNHDALHYEIPRSRFCVIFRNMFFKATCSIIPPAHGLPLVSCPQLHVQCSRRCCLYLEAVCFIRLLQKCLTTVTRAHVHYFELRHVSAKNDPRYKQAGAQLNMIGTEELASG